MNILFYSTRPETGVWEHKIMRKWFNDVTMLTVMSLSHRFLCNRTSFCHWRSRPLLAITKKICRFSLEVFTGPSADCSPIKTKHIP